MKHSKFVNISYDDLVDLFTIVEKNLPTSVEVKLKDSNHTIRDIDIKKSDIFELEEKRNKILKYLNENKDVFNGLDDLITEYEQHKTLLDPTIHIGRTKDSRTKIPYFTAKTFFPLIRGRRKEIKIHLGRAENYDFDTKSEVAKTEAKVKMIQTIARRIREGSL